MDNVSYHKSAAVLAALSLFEHRLLVIWLPSLLPGTQPHRKILETLEGLGLRKQTT